MAQRSAAAIDGDAAGARRSCGNDSETAAGSGQRALGQGIGGGSVSHGDGKRSGGAWRIRAGRHGERGRSERGHGGDQWLMEIRDACENFARTSVGFDGAGG